MNAPDFTSPVAPTPVTTDLFASLAEVMAQGETPQVHVLEGTTFAALAQRFGLSGAEALAIALLVGVEVDPGLNAAVTKRVQASHITVGGLFGVLPDLTWESFLPTSVLRSWSLIQLHGQGARRDLELKMDARILDWCLGHPGPDERLLPFLRHPIRASILAPETQALAAPAAERLAARAQHAGSGLTVVSGGDASTRERVGAEVAAVLGLTPLALDPALLRTAPVDRFALLRLVARESVLEQTLPVFALPEIDAQCAQELAWVEGAALAVAGRVTSPSDLPPGCDVVTLAEPDSAARLALWQGALGPCDAAEVGRLAEDFAIGADDILRATIGLEGCPAPKRAATARAAVRRLLAPPPDPLLTQITPRATLDDLVLPPATKATLHSIVEQVRYRATVYRDWRFGAHSDRGLGISALFSGPSGTGKTMGAEAMACALDVPLLAVNLAQVVDKYVGETEKHLDRVFGVAERSGAVLFFDEAEALFRQRGDGDSGSERFSAMTVAYLLQRLEASPATCILATNMRGAIDDAFMRRLRFAVHFAFPSAQERLRLWQTAFPPEAPVGDIAFTALATLPATGGTIRNAALGAAFMAAARGDTIGFDDVMAALEQENAKLAQPMDLGALRRRRGQ
ncbi:ATP-binding protein [Tateyamaria sp. SN3-11]|uniref:ATP-binding protein n=1 Tax=Tateyamaria sp. SN3-11 TaxID=3092147 RepID=UPI0039E85B94